MFLSFIRKFKKMKNPFIILFIRIIFILFIMNRINLRNFFLCTHFCFKLILTEFRNYAGIPESKFLKFEIPELKFFVKIANPTPH